MLEWAYHIRWHMHIVANYFERRIPPLHPNTNECDYSTCVVFVGHARDVTGWGASMRSNGDDVPVPTNVTIWHVRDV